MSSIHANEKPDQMEAAEELKSELVTLWQMRRRSYGSPKGTRRQKASYQDGA